MALSGEAPKKFHMKENIEKYYKLGDELGSGTFSVVKLGCHIKTGDMYAIKCIDKKAVGEKTEMIQQEIEILRRVRHPYIIGLKEMFETPSTIFLVMELVTGGELFDRVVELGAYSEKDASRIMRQVVDALAYLHKNGVVHRDLKPENLLLSNEKSDSDIKLADFGLSTIVSTDTLLKTACGTPGYVAPEVLRCEGYGNSVDMWSIGVILYILLCGFPPFYDDNTTILFEQIMDGHYEFPSPYWDKVSDSAKDLISKLLVVEPKKRYTAAETLKHPWIAGSTATTEAIPGVVERVRQFNAKRKLRTGMLVTLAANKLLKIMDEEKAKV